MAYNVVRQGDSSPFGDEFDDVLSASASPPQLPASTHFQLSRLVVGDSNATPYPKPLSSIVQSLVATGGREKARYDVVEDDDYAAESAISPIYIPSPEEHVPPAKDPVERLRSISRPLPRRPTASISAGSGSSISTTSPIEPAVRRFSGHSTTLRHPTPDLQTLQGAYAGNIELLERTAERLSITSSIEIAIRELHREQKRSDSCRNSFLAGQELPSASRKVSNADSIVGINKATRSGGYSRAGFMMSPVGSISRGSGGRSMSKCSKYGSRPEPEPEGRPLEAFVNGSSLLAPSIAEQDEEATTLTRPVPENGRVNVNNTPINPDDERPTTSASTNTFEQAQQMFAEFDGVHTEETKNPEDQQDIQQGEQHNTIWYNDLGFGHSSLPRAFSLRKDYTSTESEPRPRLREEQRQSMARPKSYADPKTGQEMVYYPAQIPAVLNLPKKLSNRPKSWGVAQRQSQTLDGIPAPPRGSAIWPPSLLNTNDGKLIADDNETAQLEYVPQHQRMSMGGRRLTQDLQHVPPQLRASVYFQLPSYHEPVQVKNQSAVATLDSILDASAHAPVTAFTDHAIAGHLGAEVYGRSQEARRSSKAPTPATTNKRISTASMLTASHSEIAVKPTEEKRRSTMSSFFGRSRTHLPQSHEDEDLTTDTMPLQPLVGGDADPASDEKDEGQPNEEMYRGPPTTLLAELQLRKQEQKARTRPLSTIFRDGVHSTLLEMDAVAQVQRSTRMQKHVNLAWEESKGVVEDDDEDVPLGILYADKLRRQQGRPIGLMEQREMEDNEPLSKRRDRLLGRVPAARASTMIQRPTQCTVASPEVEPEIEGETLGQRKRRLQAKWDSAKPLGHTQSVSGDFASEVMSQFCAESAKPTTDPEPIDEENEPLSRRRLRLKAEAAARAKEVGNKMGPHDTLKIQTHQSMTDASQAYPNTTCNRLVTDSNPIYTGLLAQDERRNLERASTMQALTARARISPGGYHDLTGMYERRSSQQQQHHPTTTSNMALDQHPRLRQPTMTYQNGAYGDAGNQMGYNRSNSMPMQQYSLQQHPTQQYGMNVGSNVEMCNTPMLGSGMSRGKIMQPQPVDQKQLDVVDRWRRSVKYK